MKKLVIFGISVNDATPREMDTVIQTWLDAKARIESKSKARCVGIIFQPADSPRTALAEFLGQTRPDGVAGSDRSPETQSWPSATNDNTDEGDGNGFDYVTTNEPNRLTPHSERIEP